MLQKGRMHWQFRIRQHGSENSPDLLERGYQKIHYGRRRERVTSGDSENKRNFLQC